VELDPQSEADLASVLVKATPAALEAYRQQSFHIFLYILDSDKQETDYLRRPVVFNLPEEFVRRGEIEEGEGPAPAARFRLVPVSGSAEGNPES